MRKKTYYETPDLYCLEVVVETGFASSTSGDLENPIIDDSQDWD